MSLVTLDVTQRRDHKAMLRRIRIRRLEAWVTTQESSVSKRWRWQLLRGEHGQFALVVGAFGVEVGVGRSGRRPRDLVNVPGYLSNLDWVIDELDSSFNALAVASLRYHLDHSILDNEDRRAHWEALIERLDEPYPVITDLDGYLLDDGTAEPRFTPAGNGYYTSTFEPSDQMRDLLDRQQEAERQWQNRIQRARHDFVDVLPWLWS